MNAWESMHERSSPREWDDVVGYSWHAASWGSKDVNGPGFHFVTCTVFSTADPFTPIVDDFRARRQYADEKLTWTKCGR